VLRSHRRRGIGMALLHHAFGEYYRRGYKGVTLGVDAENLTGALRLYKKVGMSIHRQFDLYEKELRPGKDVSVQELAT
jgi:mycothiol synthase